MCITSILRIISIIAVIHIILIMCNICRFVGTRDLGLADHVWQDKRTLIAQSVDNLGDQIRPAMRAGWLSYICCAYPENTADNIGPVTVVG